MNRFPKKGDFVRFKSFHNTNIRDMFQGLNNYASFNPGDLYQILEVEIHNKTGYNAYSANCMDVVPYSVIIGVADKGNKPVALRVTYEQIDTNIVDIIPGDNPSTVETLYGR